MVFCYSSLGRLIHMDCGTPHSSKSHVSDYDCHLRTTFLFSCSSSSGMSALFPSESCLGSNWSQSQNLPNLCSFFSPYQYLRCFKTSYIQISFFFKISLYNLQNISTVITLFLLHSPQIKTNKSSIIYFIK